MIAEAKFIEGDWRQKFLDALSNDGYTVFAPVLDGDITLFRPCSSSSEIIRDLINTHYPLKEVFFPKTETILQYQFRPGEDTTFSTPPLTEHKIAILGSRPCDAAALVVLDQVFNWGSMDAFYNTRRQQSMLITVGCVENDDKCFCTTFGLSPESTEGSDLLVQDMGEEGALVRVCSVKGSAFVEAHRDIFAIVPDKVVPPTAVVPVRFDIEKVKPWLDDHFEDDLWEDIALRCLGCGACSYICPTCHCYDIVDEADWQVGERRRNYDSCSYSLFTLHASGHNPRHTLAKRYRNRLMHKFKCFAERFNKRACVGCGRCIRVCGAGQNLIDILTYIASQSEEDLPLEAKS